MKTKLIEETLDKRNKLKDELFKMMLDNKPVQDVTGKFEEFEVAHKELIVAYKAASDKNDKQLAQVLANNKDKLKVEKDAA